MRSPCTSWSPARAVKVWSGVSSICIWFSVEFMSVMGRSPPRPGCQGRDEKHDQECAGHLRFTIFGGTQPWAGAVFFLLLILHLGTCLCWLARPGHRLAATRDQG